MIIEELIDASALRTGRLEVRPEAVDAVSILRQAVSLAEPIASARDVSLMEQLPDDSLDVLADPYHLRRALSALLSDAIAWCEAEGRIHAEVSGHDGQVLYSVLGPGPDVPAEELMRLLDEGVPQERREGSGAGPFVSLPLAIGADIVRAHGARITVTKESDGGTRYAFSLPRAPLTRSR